MTISDEPWWEHMFTPQELEQLEMVTDKLEQEDTITLDEGAIQVDMEIPATMVGDILHSMRMLLPHADYIGNDFLRLLCGEIAAEYLAGDLEFDELTVDEAQWFLPETFD